MKKRRNSIPFIILSLIIGGIIGGLIGLLIDEGIPKFLNWVSGNIINGIAVILVIILGLLMLKRLNKAKTYNQLMENEDDGFEDDYDLMRGKQIYKTSILIHVINILALLNISILALFMKDSGRMFFIAFITLMIATIFSYIYNAQIHKVDKCFPKLSDSNPVNTLLNNFDEGERYIMFNAIYKLFQYNLSIFLMFAMICAAAAAFGFNDIGISSVLFCVLYIVNISYYYKKIKVYYY
ncbi:DUF3169 family protein [Staphylococcus massiliensis]|uniref:DUF3169 family protein n=1 Tax=Staphylococcus massiliensis TaxID=555791 RepID=UPI001EDCF12B|nr:DUF3169 family protein [Staphylococcus massiliensis]